MSEKFSVMLHTEHYRGDHSADVEIAVEVDPDEKLEDVVRRLLVENLDRPKAKYVQYLSIRLLQPKEKEEPTFP